MAVNPPRDPYERERARRIRKQQIRRRRLVLAVFVLALIILIVALAVGLSGRGDDKTSSSTPITSPVGPAESARFTADLIGDDSVPPVQTASTGSLTLDYDATALTMSFSLSLNGLTNPSSAAIYEGAPGTSGSPVYVLFAGPPEITSGYQGELAGGTIEPGILQGSLAGGTIGDLIALIQAGNAYVSVGNKSHPVDAIRGQIR
jgi:hypothetical protein